MQENAPSAVCNEDSSSLRKDSPRNLWATLPNLKWLLGGVLLTVGFVIFEVGQDSKRLLPMTLAFLPGIPVAFFFLLFNNPREQKSGLHIIISFPFISVLWPLFLLMLIAIRPWNSKAWKQRAQV